MSLRRRNLCVVATYGYFASKYSKDTDSDPLILIVPFKLRNRLCLPIARPRQVDVGLSAVQPPGLNVYSTKRNRWARIFEKIACVCVHVITLSNKSQFVVLQICVVAEDRAPSSEHALVASPSHQRS